GAAGELFPVGRADALASRAAALLDDPARRSALSAAARRAVRAYDWETVAADVARVYETVLPPGAAAGPVTVGGEGRSEEHTSELQSRENLVCRLLLEKNKTNHFNTA